MREYEPLRQFLELARTLHFGRAARACHVTPSTLSRAVQRLETQLGQPLFIRAHHRVTLTPAGEAFRRHALAVLSEWDRFEAERAVDGGALAGTVHVYCTVTAAQSVVPDVLARVRRTHPHIRLALETGYATDAIDRVRSRDIDLSVAAVPSRLPAGVVSRALTTTAVVFVGANTPGPITDALGKRPIDWAALPLVLPARGLVRDHADAWFARRGITPRIYAEIDGHEAILSLAALGCGVGVVPQLVLHNSALRDRLTIISTRPALGQLRIGLCARNAALDNPLVAAVWYA